MHGADGRRFPDGRSVGKRPCAENQRARMEVTLSNFRRETR
jgi:hypothetical protein